MPNRILQQVAGVLAHLPVFRRSRALYSENSRDLSMPLSKGDKLWLGSWLILDDYSKGLFPPRFHDQQKAYQAEKDFRFSIPGVSAEAATDRARRKPFWFGSQGRRYLLDFNQICTHLESLSIKPPAKILELGCGTGWMAEFLATMGFEVCGTTLSEDDIRDANLRIRSLEVKGIPPSLTFIATPMESVHTAVAAGCFDFVFVYAALHHAFDWRAALHSSYACLKPRGWLLIREPNALHTYKSYRVAKLSNTHEIGFRKRELLAELRKAGFRTIKSVGARLHCWLRPHWLLAQK